MAESSVRASSFKKFLKSVGIDSDTTGERSATLPSKPAKSASTFYTYSNEDLTECEVTHKHGWLLKQSRGVLKSWQVGPDKNTDLYVLVLHAALVHCVDIFYCLILNMVTLAVTCCHSFLE